jgi:hypothetical protein
VIPNIEDLYGGLPYRNQDDSVVFDNVPREVCCFIPELWERLAHGLRIESCYEVLHFDENNRAEGPFRGYVSYNIREKIEASGWKGMTDADVSEWTYEQKLALCENEGLKNHGVGVPRPEYVESNPGLRYCAKLRVNSIWGKFVQQDSSRAREYLQSYGDYINLTQTIRLDKSSLQFRKIGKDMFDVVYKWKDFAKRRASAINPYLGASVTGWARVILHKKIRQTRAAYCDTDSVIYLHTPEMPLRWPDEGSGLGEWSDEFERGNFGVQFYAVAPKNYCIVYDHPDAKGMVCKMRCKGISLNYENSSIITEATYRRLILDAVIDQPTLEPPVMAHYFQIVLNHYQQGIKDLAIISRSGYKQIQAVYNKRQLITLPWCEWKDEARDKLNAMLDTCYISELVTVPFGYPGIEEDLWGKFYPQWYT